MSLLNKVRSVTGSPTVPPTPLTNGAPPPQIFAQQASAPLQGNPPWVTTANQAVQGQQYVLPNGVVATFLVAFDQGGALGYSFAPVAGGPPVNLGANDPINASTGTAPAVKERKLQIPVAPVPAAPVAAAPVPVAPAPVHPAPVPQVPRAPVAAAPTPAAAPEPKKGRGPGKKQLEARNAEESGTTDVVTELQDAIEASKVIFCQAFGVQPTPEQALPIWQALLGR